MIINSKYSKSFVSDLLSDSKYDELYSFAKLINNHKNVVSLEVNSNLSFYMDMSFFNFLKHMRDKYRGTINSNFDKQLYQDVFTCYQNKFDSIQRKIAFEKITFKGFEFFKRDSKKNKKGDLKKVVLSKEKTKLSVVLTYLARYGNENTIDYISGQVNKKDLDKDKLNLYNNILCYVNKFGFDRLLCLALQKRNRILDYYSAYSVQFKALTFRGRSRLAQDIISYNENFNSVINSFINVSWLGRGNKLSIPVKYSKEYHGQMKEYHKDSPDVEYMVVFHKDKIKINICKDGERYFPDNKTNYVGIDVNVKHNLFTLSDGVSFDYSRILLNELTAELSRVDELKKRKEYEVGKKKQRQIDSIRNKIKKSNEQLCSVMCKYLNSIGKNHIVMEDLDNSFGKSYIKDKTNNDVNFNRVVKELNLSSLKQMVEHIGRKYDICVSTVHASYTSKTCPICGCIEDENRPTQESFKCINCGHENNADINAAINIKNRVSSTVLKKNLLKQTKIGNETYEPKPLKRETVKEILLSLRYNSPKVSRDIIQINTFEYV